MLQLLVLLCMAVCVLPFTAADAIITHSKRAEPKHDQKGVFYPKSVVAVVQGQGGIHGTVKFSLKNPNDPHDSQLGVFVEVDLFNLPQGTFPYHIHEKAITNGDCMSAEGHYNPMKCDEKKNPKCKEAGDLSGKHRPLNGGGAVHLKYHDPSLKLSPSQRGILGRSVVIHSADLKRVACGNIPLGHPLDTPHSKRVQIDFLSS